MMSAKHYREIADTLAAEHSIAPTPEAVTAVENLTRSLADKFKCDNARFDRKRFYKAALLGERRAHTSTDRSLQAVG